MSSSTWTERLRRLLAPGLVAALAAAAAPVRAGEVHFGSRIARGATSIHTLQQQRFGATVRQSRDFSCGAAAVATLLSYHMDRPTTEDEVFDIMWTAGDHALIQERGFSLLDIKAFFAGHGYEDANGYKITLQQLREAGLPALALISTGGYRHFVVVKGVEESRVVIGDPVLGTRIVARDEFERMRDEILFVVRPGPEQPKPAFNLARDWRGRPQASLERATRARVDTLGPLLRPGYNEF